jgi:hypothetical protein
LAVGVPAHVSGFDGVEQRLMDIEASGRPDGGGWPQQPPTYLVVVDDDGYRTLPTSIDMLRAALALAHADLAGSPSECG